MSQGVRDAARQGDARILVQHGGESIRIHTPEPGRYQIRE